MTMYSDAVNRLKSQWQTMLDAGRVPCFEILDPTLSECKVYHLFYLDFYQAGNNLWYFKATDNYGRKLFGLSVDQYFDDLSHYLEIMYDRCFEECCK